MLLRFVLILLFTGIYHASAWGCENKLVCIEEDNWSIGVAFGVGARTNPLVDGDAIPLIVLPDVAWYGEHAYFDNGEFGYQWQPHQDVTTEVFFRANTERAYFAFWQPSNILLPTSNATDGADTPNPDDPEGEPPRYISVNDIAQRKWSLDIGVRTNWFNDKSRWSLTFIHDALNVHNGFSATGQYQHDFEWQDWTLSTHLSVTYKSNSLIDYYYGISERDTSDENLWYNAGSALQVTGGLLFNKPLNQQWHWLGRIQFTSLSSGMTDSPLVSKRYVTNMFFGVGYRF
ncbi:MipA/OmpV family protein [Alteromonas gracilis]|uniref:MipA/OmpV family protein n=1 Tax=Alteromonas gracilis TaxID=1479524 RepID=UPI003736207A